MSINASPGRIFLWIRRYFSGIVDATKASKFLAKRRYRVYTDKYRH